MALNQVAVIWKKDLKKLKEDRTKLLWTLTMLIQSPGLLQKEKYSKDLHGRMTVARRTLAEVRGG